jgi:hypothetical protein
MSSHMQELSQHLDILEVVMDEPAPDERARARVD